MLPKSFLKYIIVLTVALADLACSNTNDFHFLFPKNTSGIDTNTNVGANLPRQYDIPASVGAVFWSGQYAQARSGERLPDGVSQLASKGFQNIRIVLSPSAIQATQYDISGIAYTDSNFLTNTIQSQQYVDALSDPRLKIIGLTTYDAITTGTDGSSRNFMNASFLQSRAGDIINDYYGMALFLFRKFKNTNKTFFISNWEGDNSMYCGSAYAFKLASPYQGTDFRTWCLNNYFSSYGVASPAAAIQGFRQWFLYRQTGIAQAAAQAQNEGVTGVTVLSAIEFNSVHMIHDIGYPSLLYDLIASVGPGLATYSAYESTNAGTLLTDFPVIESQLSGIRLAITEFGFSPDNFGSQAVPNLSNTIKQVMSLAAQNRAYFGQIWQAYRDGATPEYGLLDNNAGETPLFAGLLSGIAP